MLYHDFTRLAEKKTDIKLQRVGWYILVHLEIELNRVRKLEKVMRTVSVVSRANDM